MNKIINMITVASIFVGLVSSKADDRPNIVFLFTDDHAPHAISAYDGWLKKVRATPTIDKLAAEGMLFVNSFCTNSICGPSRGVIQTGKHSHKNGFMNNGNTFDWNQQTFPKLLQKAGYQTAIFGKSHLRGHPRGYDKWAVMPGQGLYYNPDFITPEGTITIEGYCTDLVTDMAVDFLKEDRDEDEPFMLMVQHKAPHRNWMPALRHLDLYDNIVLPEPDTLFDNWSDNASAAPNQELEIDRHMHLNFDLFVDLDKDFFDPTPDLPADRSAWRNMKRMTDEQMKIWRAAYAPRDAAFHAAKLKGKDLVRWKYQRYAKNYLRSLRGVDDSLERLQATLTQLGLDDNTIVIYSSDQGFYIGDHGWYDKRWMYEESLKMPFIVKWLGAVKPASRTNLMIQNIDYAPTFLDIAGADIPDDMQGVSLLPLLKGERPSDWRKSIYYHYYEYPSVHMIPRHNGVRTNRYKLMHFYEFDEWEFYDLKEDPDELHNLYNDPDYTSQIKRHERELNRLVAYYEDDSDTSAKPMEWRIEVRQKRGWENMKR
ncbi:MAG: sulfatase [Opitutaceae bacterium]|nr:sulfatase [Opitutaceae bacterium]